MSTPHSAASSPSEAPPAVRDEIVDALTRSPRQLPSHYLYDRLGSSLFEAICHLPWYRIAEIERDLLQRHGAAIFSALGHVSSVVELGPGSGAKLVTLLSTQRARHLDVHLVDVSLEALEQASRTLATLPDISVVTHQATYDAGLAAIGNPAVNAGRSLVLFLGSNIGNFDPAAAASLMLSIRESLQPGDALLLGTDLVKPERELLLAYDDPLGVTAAFNRNLLVRLNHELGSNFDLSGFSHRAIWNGSESRVEMHLVSMRRQLVRIPGAELEITFDKDEPIWTESSYKYEVDELAPMFAGAGFRSVRQWVADGFALSLGQAE
jgi:dimethylhistidine N-methyltransferase